MGGILLAVYVVVAIVNYSPVQSLLGSVVSDNLSKRSGGTVRVRSIGLNVFNSVKLRDVLLVTPDNDTVCNSERMTVRFKEFPITSKHLHVNRVYVRNTYFHFSNGEWGDPKTINLDYLLKLFKPKEPKKEHERFLVYVDQVVMRNIHYKMDLRQSPEARRWDDGVDIPHMEYYDMSGKIRNIRVDSDHVTCKIEKMSCREKSGFKIDKLSGNIYVSHHGISCTDMEIANEQTHLKCDALLDYPRWETMQSYVDSVYMMVRLYPGTVGCMSDAAYWAPTLWGMDEQVKVDGLVYGPVADLHATGVNVAFGQSSQMAFDGYIYGLPNMDTTIISGEVHQFHTTYEDLAAVRHPDNRQMRAEKIIKSLNHIDMSASFLGTINDFYATADVKTDMGALDADLVLKYDVAKNDFSYHAELNSNSFQLASLMPNEWVTRSGFTVTAHGSGFDPKKMEATVEGQLFNTTLRGKHLMPTDVKLDANKGQVDLALRCADPQLDVDVEAQVDLKDSLNNYIANLKLNHVNLKDFHLMEADSMATVHTDLQLRAQGNDLETIKGSLRLDNTKLKIDDRVLRLNNTTLTADNQAHHKNLVLQCDMFRMGVKGYFEYTDFGPLVEKFKHDYLPIYFAGKLSPAKLAKADSALADCDVEFNMEWTDTMGRLQHFVPQLTIANGTAIQGNYNYTESLKLAARSTAISYGTVDLNEVIVTTHTRGGSYSSVITADQVTVGGTPMFGMFRLFARTAPENSTLSLFWDDRTEHPGKGQLSFDMTSTADSNIVSITRNEFFIHGDPWKLSVAGPIVLARDGITVHRLRGASEGQSVLASFDRHHEEDDELLMEFQSFDLERISFLLQPTGFNVSGLLDGNFSISGFDEVPHFDANLTIADCEVNEQLLGDAQVSVNWNSEQDRLDLDLVTSLPQEGESLTPLRADGYLHLGPSENDSTQMYFDVSFDEFSLQMVSPLVRSFASRLEGKLHGDFTVSGSPKAPVLSGVAFIDEGLIKVDFLNTIWTFADSVRFDNDHIVLKNFAIEDEYGDVAYLNGGVSHHNFKDLLLDVGINTDKFLFLNTTARQNSSYYGTVFAYANGRVTGPFEDLDLRVRARTMPGSTLVVPISDQRQVRELDFIEFVSYDGYEEEDEVMEKAKSQTDNKFRLTIDIDVTPDVKLMLPMDFSSMYVDIGATGQGDLQMSVSSETDFSLLGDYEIDDGNLSLNILGLITKNFTIDEGSSIKFTGPILDAIFDIAAVYSQRVNLSSLTGSVSTTEHAQSNVPVESVIALNGTLTSPTLNFDIRLPNADQSLQDEVFAYIDRTNERDMLNQTVSLLVMGQFYNNGAATTNTSLSDNAISSGYSVVANSLGSVVSNMVEFVDINFGYRAATDLTTEHYEVDINKEWNKFYLETSFGYGGDSRELANVDNGNNLTGDMLLGYKLNQRLHLFVFNRSNTNDYTRADLPYKQGLGLKYTKEFDTWKDLFRPNKKKEKRTSKK